MDRKFQLFPIRDDVGYEFYKIQLRAFWTTDELDFSRERDSYNSLSKAEQKILSRTLAFFAASDLIVNDRLINSIMQESPTPEFDMALSWQCAMECVHSETYGKLIQELVGDVAERIKLFDGLNSYQTIGEKRDWYLKNSQPELPIAHRLITQLCVEGIHFSSSFALIAWLRKRLPGQFTATCSSNDLIMRDEGLHAKMAIEMFNRLANQQKAMVNVEKLMREAVELEINFINEAYTDSVWGMNAELMTSHVKFITNYWSRILNIGTIFPEAIKPVFTWLEAATIETKTNFFEQRPTEYIMTQMGDGIKFNADF